MCDASGSWVNFFQVHRTDGACHRADSNDGLRDDWVEVADITNGFPVSRDESFEQVKTMGDQSAAPLIDLEQNHHPPAVCVEGLVRKNCDQAEAAANLQALPRSQGDLKQEIHLARARVRQMRQQYLQAEQQLKDLETRLVKEEGEAAPDCPCLQCADEFELVDDAMSECSDASSSVPPIVEEYFQLAREAFVRDERLAELDFDFKEAEAIRNHIESHNIDLNAEAEVLENFYQRKRQELCEALTITNYQLYIRRKACLAEGIEPEDFRYRGNTLTAQNCLEPWH